jgi:hypothetical protein
MHGTPPSVTSGEVVPRDLGHVARSWCRFSLPHYHSRELKRHHFPAGRENWCATVDLALIYFTIRKSFNHTVVLGVMIDGCARYTQRLVQHRRCQSQVLGVNPRVPRSGNEITGKVLLSSKGDKQVLNLINRFIVREPIGGNNNKQVADSTLAEIIDDQPFEIKTGEMKTLDFSIPYSFTKNNNPGDVMGDAGDSWADSIEIDCNSRDFFRHRKVPRQRHRARSQRQGASQRRRLRCLYAPTTPGREKGNTGKRLRSEYWN